MSFRTSGLHRKEGGHWLYSRAASGDIAGLLERGGQQLSKFDDETCGLLLLVACVHSQDECFFLLKARLGLGGAAAWSTHADARLQACAMLLAEASKRQPGDLAQLSLLLRLFDVAQQAPSPALRRSLSFTSGRRRSSKDLSKDVSKGPNTPCAVRDLGGCIPLEPRPISMELDVQGSMFPEPATEPPSHTPPKQLARANSFQARRRASQAGCIV